MLPVWDVKLERGDEEKECTGVDECSQPTEESVVALGASLAPLITPPTLDWETRQHTVASAAALDDANFSSYLV